MGDHRADPRARRRRSTPPTAEPARQVESSTPGRRRATSPAARSSRARSAVASPLLLGAVALATSAGGVVATADSSTVTELPSTSAAVPTLVGSKLVAGASSIDSRRAIVSRDSRRDLPTSNAQRLALSAERQTRARNTVLAQFTRLAEAQSAKLELNKWYLPVNYVALTARYGEYGLWASSHTGLDFNGDEGDPIYAVANGVVTSVGYDGAYGNKTVLTLEDGTEIWYCHQSRYLVTSGDQVRGGEQIGAIGSTGNVTGSHLHLEVRPSGGGPADPYPAFAANNLL